jgi:glycosyltransferase involved in cell wall biosynthesis
MKPLVSILIPAYNSQKWIVDTIQSALAQTWPRKEVIIVDDGSTDGTVNIIRQYESSMLKLIQQENGGACRARNRAYRECQGDYIQWLDADDLLHPHKIERQMIIAEKEATPKVMFASAWGRFYYRPRKAIFRPTPLWRDLDAVEWLILRLSNPWMMQTSSWLVSRWLTNQAGPWDERLKRNQDGEYSCRIISRSDFVRFVSESRVYYRMTNPTRVSKLRSRQALESICLSKDLETRHLLARENSERTRRACINRLNYGVSVLYAEAPDLADILRRRIEELGGEIVPINISRKYVLARRILGERNARYLKNVVWETQGRILCSIDRWMSKYDGCGY